MRLAAFNGSSPKISLQTQKSRRYLVHRPSFVTNFVPWQRVSIGKKCSLQHSVAHPWKPPPYRRKNLADIFYTSRVIANFVRNFVGMATGVNREKCNWQHLMAHPRNPPYKPRRKNLLRKPNYSQFYPKFRCHGNGGQSGKNAIGSIRWPISDNPPIGAKISQSPTQAEL